MHILHYLQTTQHLSRRTIVALIKQGQILVNQQPVQSFKHELSPGDEVMINNPSGSTSHLPWQGGKTKEFLFFSPLSGGVPEGGGGLSEQKLLLFNKPKGYVVSKSDPHNKTIYELLPPEFQHYYYIGRLDKESRGLVLLTNSPELVHQYEHPKFQIEKKYLIQLSSPFSSADQQKAKIWIRDEGELLKFKDIASTSFPTSQQGVATPCPYTYKIVLTEGKKRHIRRVIKALGYELLDLQRVKEGEYCLGDLKEGEWREMDRKDSGVCKIP